MDPMWRFDEDKIGPFLVTKIGSGEALIRLQGDPGSFGFLAGCPQNMELGKADWEALMPSFGAALNLLNAQMQQAKGGRALSA